MADIEVTNSSFEHWLLWSIIAGVVEEITIEEPHNQGVLFE